MILLPDDRRAEIARLPVEPAQGQSLASLLTLHRVALRQLLAVEASLRAEYVRLEAILEMVVKPIHGTRRRRGREPLHTVPHATANPRNYYCPKCHHWISRENVAHERACGTMFRVRSTP